MALMRYVGPHDEVRVFVAGNEIGTIEKDGSIVVPDELAELVEWPEELWENAAKDSSRKGAPKNGETGNPPASDDAGNEGPETVEQTGAETFPAFAGSASDNSTSGEGVN